MRRALFAVLLSATACMDRAVVLSQPEHADAIAAWGDSMTQGFGPDNYPDQLAVLLGRSVFNGGIGGETSDQVLARFLADTAHRKDAVVLWIGRNNLRQPEQIMADVATVVARLKNARHHFVILAIHNKDGPAEYPGGEFHTVIMSLNARLAAKYPDHFLDIRSYLVSQYDPTDAHEVMDHDHDMIPISMRRDQIHLSRKGNELVARKVAEYAVAHAW